MEASADVVAINSDDEQCNEVEDKPIIRLFKHLTKESNQKTVLTNAQIIDILKEEFDIDIWDIHELEGDIFITILKMYLKDWPLWEEFDKLFNNLKHKNDTEAMNRVLQTNYKKLKEHLNTVLHNAKQEAKDAVLKVQQEMSERNDKIKSNVILDVTATRSQLNKLFYRRPLPKHNNTIFNSTKHTIPTQIMVNDIPLEAILNWWGINIFLKVSAFKINIYERHNIHELRHVLVNRNLTATNPCTELEQELKVRVIDSTTRNMSEFINTFNDLSDNDNREVYDFIQRDLKLLPDVVFNRALFRRYTNKYPYVRYLYQEAKSADMNSRRYDIQLQETISPKYQLYIRSMTSTPTFLVVECEPCGVKFLGPNLLQELRAHFNEFHLSEPDCTCTNCSKTFPMVALAKNWWCHRC
ncbi:hypothetical protein KGM_211521 [Danaus plexippus plexippus]|uniref:C2H2-type domain-containing protein n=1 Tax=Danaus plexippus plexippus TaxID=278856 RepID=A0A212F4W0_DANPL|nr:uncharacterized protein LOC116776955 [Danaus plexippus plexippus]OWR41534.1 hypothetical protein KGM_211523 [Danaus plexippus plexippus]OWR48766.1 hypothetical protein KGM_211521 [Danaus plexippus plexippus]